MANVELKFDIIYNNLPALKEGFEYYTLRQLVHNLEYPYDAGTILLTEGPLTVRYIRPSHLFTDYRKCEIDYDGIGKAPFKSNNIHLVMAKGEFASFINGQMKVGRIHQKNWGDYGAFDVYLDDITESLTHFPVDKTIYHFTPRRDGTAISEYILKELLSEYVKNQAKRICSITGLNYLRPNEFEYLKIAVPCLEEQDNIIASERYTTKQLNDVLKIIDSLFDEHGSIECQKILQSIFSTLYNNSDFDSHAYYNPIRRVLEWMFRAAREKGLLHDKCFDSKDRVNLTDCYRFMAGKPALHSGVICRTAHFPVIIADNAYFILHTTGGGSHTTKVSEKEISNLTAYWAKIDTPYLLYCLTFLLCDIIIWFGQYVRENEDIEKNKALWRDLVLSGEVERGVEGLYVGDCKLLSTTARTCMEGDYVRVTKARENERQNSSHLLIAEEVTRLH